MKEFVSGFTRYPFEDLLWLLGMPADDLFASLVLLAMVVIGCELARVALATEFTRSALVHVVICMLTVVVLSAVLGGVLVYAAIEHPERAWINLGIVLGLYVLWYATGELTKVVRKHNEGADLGFMTVGGMITFPAGILAALLT